MPKFITEIILPIMISFTLLDTLGCIAWAASGQPRPSDYHIGYFTEQVIGLFVNS